MRQFLGSILIASLVPLAPAAAQQAQAPDTLVKTVTQEVLDVIRQDKDIQSGNTKKTIALVEQKVLPHFNFMRMTALAMGINWRKATPEQQKLLVDEFRTLLVRTYSTALSAYRNQTIEFKPLRAQPSDTDVMVRSEVRQSGTEPVSIDYSMEKTASDWKVYDVAVGGVSLVTTYRDTFANEVRTGGIDGLIKSLTDKNRQLEARSR
jgi:phospholipid transport system substrate-binding protein